MNFDFSEEQKLLKKTVQDFLTEQAPLAVNRAVLESDAVYDEGLWKSAAEMGWLGAAIPEEYGGAGFGYLELVLIAEEVGRALVPIPFGTSVGLATEAILAAGKPEQKEKYLTGLAAGDRIGTLAIAEGPGPVKLEDVTTTFENGALNGTKIAVPDGGAADTAVVLANTGGATSLVIVDLGADGVTRTVQRSIDPTRTVATLEFKGAAGELLGGQGEGAALTQRVLDRAAILTAWEQLGGAQRAFDITQEFTTGRYAFGRPISSFQAIRHRLADQYVDLELARSNCYYGAWALETNADELPIAACNARISATHIGELTSVEMVQMHGGVGYTWEYDCHMFYRRAKHLGLVLGSADEWRERLIQHLIAKQAA
ncbi:MAG: acyl-CoA/acyl-ACP dehydrogenase [Deltaproteobacteria bacterium]|nr:acyl-CoA/acyl-ACP dehydrogenase [Deltaproteobacteria bacterium]MBW2413006.1 acyl-CoA/acyl-ACP dehydrogenase [Deltaproteobacteria bacterium]